MESLNKAVNKDSILVAYLRGGVGSPMKSPGGDRFSRNYQRRSSGSSRSPLSPLENMKTPMVEEDEVLVMDGVPISPLVGSGSSSNSLPLLLRERACIRRNFAELGRILDTAAMRLCLQPPGLFLTHYQFRKDRLIFSDGSLE